MVLDFFINFFESSVYDYFLKTLIAIQTIFMCGMFFYFLNYNDINEEKAKSEGNQASVETEDKKLK